MRAVTTRAQPALVAQAGSLVAPPPGHTHAPIVRADGRYTDALLARCYLSWAQLVESEAARRDHAQRVAMSKMSGRADMIAQLAFLFFPRPSVEMDGPLCSAGPRWFRWWCKYLMQRTSKTPNKHVSTP